MSTLRFLALGALGALLLSTAACSAGTTDGSEATESDIVGPTGVPSPPHPSLCGGIAGIQCPAGFSCNLDGHYPDAAGHCERDVVQMCGGIAGLVCPSGFECKLDGHYPDAAGSCEKIPAWDICRVDADCVAVPAHDCCSWNEKEAVNKNHIAEYDASFSPFVCAAVACAPPFVIPVTKAPLCNAGRCAMVKVDDIACGGHSPNPHHCPADYVCTGAGLPVDAPGQCTQE